MYCIVNQETRDHTSNPEVWGFHVTIPNIPQMPNLQELVNWNFTLMSSVSLFLTFFFVLAFQVEATLDQPT
jgi:hypothetical protein